MTGPLHAARADGLLAAFDAAGVLAPADVHVARRLGVLAGSDDERALLAVAFAVRAPRLGHVFVDLRTIATTATSEHEEPVDVAALPWPEPGAWAAAVAASPVAAVGEPAAAGEEPRPLRLVDDRLYLDRYWREEVRIAADLTAFAETPAAGVHVTTLQEGLERLFAGDARGGRQELAAATAVLRRLTVLGGGPGTGKTTTVARIAALLLEQAAARGEEPPLVALAAPTGKAAARLEEAVHEQAATMPVTEEVRAGLLALEASTLHRLLGWRPDSSSRFRHHRENHLPHDVVIVDETSMVSLSLMGRLVEAVRPAARLVLVGDPGQLTSIEAGAVLGDVVGPAADGPRMRAAARTALAGAVGRELPEVTPAGEAVAVGDGTIVLDRVYRHGGTIADLAAAIRTGDEDRVVDVLRAGGEDVTWLAADVADAEAGDALRLVREAAVAAGGEVLTAARAGDPGAAIRALAGFRLLCAHRRGPYGAAHWMGVVERWLAGALEGFDPSGGDWYVGRPLLVTENDASLGLFNGDTGVVVASGPDRIAAAFERRGDVLELSPTRLHAVDTVYAMTVHKSQGSQFGTACVLLPADDSPILTRELLYTAVTRAVERVVVVGPEATVRAAVARPAARASALRARLWG